MRRTRHALISDFQRPEIAAADRVNQRLLRRNRLLEQGNPRRRGTARCDAGRTRERSDRRTRSRFQRHRVRGVVRTRGPNLKPCQRAQREDAVARRTCAFAIVRLRAQHHATLRFDHLNDVRQLRETHHFELTPLFTREEGIQLRHKNQYVARCRRQFDADKDGKLTKLTPQNAPSDICRGVTIYNRNPVNSELCRIRNSSLDRRSTARSGVNVQVYQHRFHVTRGSQTLSNMGGARGR